MKSHRQERCGPFYADVGAIFPAGMSLSYQGAVRLLRLLTRVFFRRVEVTGLEHVPKKGGGLLVAWHPNGLIDPGLILTRFERRVVFGARHGLFALPVLGWIMKGVGAVPIRRAADVQGSVDERRLANKQSLGQLSAAIASGSFAALFPEGVSHDAPHLMDLKTGAARLYYDARSATPPDQPVPVIVPVGLHYDDKRAFRSNALVEFHPPMELPAELDVTPASDEPDERTRERARLLTEAIERELNEVVHATESWDLHHLMNRARKLVRAERAKRVGSSLGKPKMQERVLGFARVWAGYYARLETHPEEVAMLRARLEAYDQSLRALAMEDHELDRDPTLISPWLGFLLFLQAATVYVVLPPILLVGYIVNLPVALFLLFLSKLVSRAYKDEATVKLLVGAVLFPLSWIAAGFGTMKLHDWLHTIVPGLPATPLAAGLFVVLLAVVGGAAALRYFRVARETARAIRVRAFRVWRRREIERLRVERGQLFEAITGLGEGLELPGAVRSDGRIVQVP
jgi:1-acyl-sn-glycerol-3-phosphate acyltransferase